MHLFWTSFLVFVVCLLTGSWYHWRFIKTARNNFPELWEDMGEPTIWTDSTLIDSFGTYKYIYQRQYKKRQNDQEIAFCERFRNPMIATYICALLSVIVFIAGLFIWGKP